MKAIVNATPLISLAVIKRLYLLKEIFDAVLVPDAVYREVVVRGAGKPGASDIAQLTWLTVVQPESQPGLEPQLFGLDAGETEVLLLARQIKPDWVLIDERLGRRIAFAMGLPVKGTMGILLSSVLGGLLTKDEAHADLQKLVQAGIRIAPRWQHWFFTELDK